MLNRFSLYQINNSMANLYIGLGGAGVKTLREYFSLIFNLSNCIVTLFYYQYI